MSGEIKVGLVQINNSFSGQNYLPLSVGVLQAYAQKHLAGPERYEFLLPIYSRIPVDEAVEELLDAHVVFFSTYVWNFRISLEVAKKLKRYRPETLIVFGGPHVPDRIEGFMKQHLFVDIVCHGEGEQVAASLLENCISKIWDKIPSISFLGKDGSLVQNPRGTRIRDFSTLPSPYLAGVFAPLMKSHPEEHWIALWETNRGCPFSCTFCDWGSAIQSKVYPFDIERIFKEVEWFAAHKIEFVFCCDANFGILPRDVDIASYVAEIKRKFGYPHALSVQNTKNATERAYKTQKILAGAGLNKGVDIALQSLDPNTLKSIKRGNISTETYQELQRRFTRDNIETYTDLILGLPGETYESFTNAVSKIIENGQHNRIQFNNLSILPNAEMGDPDYQKQYGMVTVETKIINVHGSLSESEEEVYETQQLVIATGAMPKGDWVRTRTFSWMVALLHFDKILQIPFVLLHEVCSINYRELIELFSERSPASCSVISSIRSFFMEKARNIQNGGPEYCRSDEWLNIWWPADEYILIRLCVENNVNRFYEEAEQILDRFLGEKFLSLPPRLLHEAIELNKTLIKLPFQTEDLEWNLSYNIWEFYQCALRGNPIPLQEKMCRCYIDRTSKAWLSWDEWCREVIWFGNKKGAYLYGNRAYEAPEIAGHF